MLVFPAGLAGLLSWVRTRNFDAGSRVPHAACQSQAGSSNRLLPVDHLQLQRTGADVPAQRQRCRAVLVNKHRWTMDAVSNIGSSFYSSVSGTSLQHAAVEDAWSPHACLPWSSSPSFTRPLATCSQLERVEASQHKCLRREIRGSGRASGCRGDPTVMDTAAQADHMIVQAACSTHSNAPRRSAGKLSWQEAAFMLCDVSVRTRESPSMCGALMQPVHCATQARQHSTPN